MEELWHLVRSIPRGRVVGYGALGRVLDRPISGLLVGRAMARCPSDLPWWRVVGRDGQILTDKRDPRLGDLQRQRLQSEGVAFVEDYRVAPSALIDPEELRPESD